MANVLIIDDDQALTTVFETALTSKGITVSIANDAQTGIEMAKTQKPDIILLDQVLPDIGGNEVLQTLKKDPDTTSIPVAMLSNFGQSELVKKALEIGAAEYILKYQIDPNDLVSKINTMVSQKN